jgi:hypothetical protein
MEKFEVIVGNIGTVYSGTNRHEAEGAYNEYVVASKLKAGRAAGEQVTMMKDGEPVHGYDPEASTERNPLIKASRESKMYKFGGHGVDVKLYDMSNTANIVWVRGNSYVRVQVPEPAEFHQGWPPEALTHRNNDGEAYYIVSVNGMGEVRWYVNNTFDLRRPENADVADYFRNRKSR